MNRPAALTGAVLVLLGLALFATKVLVYELPLMPTDARGLWQVELRVSVRGDGRRGSVSALLPRSDPGQVVFDERSSSDRLVFSIRSQEHARLGVWSGWLEGIQEIVYVFRVRSFPLEVPLPEPGSTPSAETPDERYLEATSEFPASAPEVQALLRDLALPGPLDPVGRVRQIFAFVSHEIATVQSAGADALLTLAQREGSPEGKTRLLVTLLRGVGHPARTVRGLELREGAAPQSQVWGETWMDGRWLPLSTELGFFGTRPADLIALGDGDRELVEATGVTALGHRYDSLRQHLRPEEVAAMMAPTHPALAAVSLYRLPLPTQQVLRGLLLFPLGALVVAFFRNVVGIPTYGTFMPILIAFAIREFSLASGLGLVAFVLSVGVLGRLPLERLRLLLVPRLSLLLCLVVLCVTALALAGRDLGQGGFFVGVLFPIVILTMLVERVSITIAEEGLRAGLTRAGWSVVVVTAVYPVFRSAEASHLMFTFPELLLVVMGVLVWIGAYTGFRVVDLIRFRSLLREPPSAEAA